MDGRLPVPTALKVFAGNPGRHPFNAQEPIPRAAPLPECPEWFWDEAREVWDRTIAELDAMGIMTAADTDALANYCVAYAHWKEAILFMRSNGDVYTVRDEDGRIQKVRQFPQVNIARNMYAVMNRYQQELGLTPSARTRIQRPEFGYGTESGGGLINHIRSMADRFAIAE